MGGEKFLMTTPQPLYDWIAIKAKKHDMSIQGWTRWILNKEKLADQEGRVGVVGWRVWEQLNVELTKTLLPIYEKFATERKRLKIIDITDRPQRKFYQYDRSSDENYKEMHTPFLEGDAGIVMFSSGKINTKRATEMIRELAEKENLLLSGCDDQDFVVQTLNFSCFTWHDGSGNTWGIFREKINSTRTPKIHDMWAVIGRAGVGFGADWLRKSGDCPECGAPIYKPIAWYDTSEMSPSYRCVCRLKS